MACGGIRDMKPNLHLFGMGWKINLDTKKSGVGDLNPNLTLFATGWEINLESLIFMIRSVALFEKEVHFYHIH